MASVNRVILIGNLGAKPELKYLPSGQAVCEMRMATNERWKDKDGKQQEKVEWHRIVVWGKQAENCAQYLDKGRSCYIEGRIQTRSWEDKTTKEKKYMTEIVANTVQFLGGGKSEGGGKQRSNDTDDDPGGSGYGPPPGGSSGGDFGGPPSDDDIPF